MVMQTINFMKRQNIRKKGLRKLSEKKTKRKHTQTIKWLNEMKCELVKAQMIKRTSKEQ